MTDQLTTTTAWPAHDPGTYRRLPASSRPVDPRSSSGCWRPSGSASRSWSGASGAHNERAPASRCRSESLARSSTGTRTRSRSPSARGAWLTDVDGNRLLDLSMGFGAMLVGHLNPLVVEQVDRGAHDTGTLFVTPSPQATEMSERFCERFQLDMIRFTNSGTESLMYAIRCARAYTERKAIVKIEGGYHGGYDALQVSVKPALAEIGPADAPIPQVPFDVEAGTVHVVAYNDLADARADPGRARHRDRRPGGRAGHREPRDRGARRGLPRRRPCGRATQHGVVLDLRRGQDRPDRRLRRCRPAARRHARPDHPGQVDRRGPAAGGVRRQARGHGGRRRRPDGPLRHLQRQPARHGGRPGRRRDLHP